jgi:hypothetical protein
MKETGKCSICRGPYDLFGNNPWPIRIKGRCCHECNERSVIPARLAEVRKSCPP